MRVFPDLSRLSQAACNFFSRSAARAVSERGRFLTALSGGSTPTTLYHLLAKTPLDWEHVHLFWGDERCVPVDDPGNNYGQARKVFLDKAAIPAGNIHRIISELPPAEAATDYARILGEYAETPLEWPRFDLVLLGLGEDGHTASLFPGSPIDPPGPVIAVTADYQDRPANRVSLTPRVFNTARLVLFLVSGHSKSEALAGVFKGGHHPDRWPAQRIRPRQGSVTWMVDAQAASDL